MFDLSTILTNTDGTASIPVDQAIICMGGVFLLGIVIGLTYLYTNCKSRSSGETNTGEFLFTLIVLPVVISVIIMLVGSNVARAFSLSGAFALIRFRSAPGTPKDITYICFAMAVGLAGGMGMLSYAALVTLFICLLLVLMDLVPKKNKAPYSLRITLPEDLSYADLFDDLLLQHTRSYKLTRVKTTNLGAYFELNYDICLDDTSNTKALIDEVRSRNGNLPVNLMMSAGQ